MPFHLLIAPDKFKGCLTAAEAARLMAIGLRRARPGARATLLPLADGGDGTGDVLARALGGVKKFAWARDPLGRPVRASWVWFPKTKTAFVELASASGLWRLKAGERDPLKTSTHGTGELIRRALLLKPKRIWVAVGGSATTDGGAGLLQALGARLVMGNGERLDRPARGEDLSRVARLDLSGLTTAPAVRVLCDVTNPLTGPRGAAKVFGPQKGARPAAVEELERGMKNWARVLRRATGRRVLGVPRLGAAGGAAAGLAAVLGARPVSGADAVMEAVGFQNALRRADAVLTGEGAVDGTTPHGKAIGEAIRRSRAAGKPVYVLAGTWGKGSAEALRGVQGSALAAPGMPVEESVKRTRRLLPGAVEKMFSKIVPPH